MRLRNAWWIATEGLRFLWACRQKNRGWIWRIIPIPPKEWVKWRLDTAYGEWNPRPPLWYIWRDLCRFLLWRRQMRKGIEARKHR